MKNILLFPIILLNAIFCNSSRILFFHDLGTRSHLHLYFPLVEELLDRGHTVTGAYYASAKIKHENYTEILLPDSVALFMNNISKFYMEDTSSKLNPMRILKVWEALPVAVDTVMGTLKSQAIQDLIIQKFDIIISTSFNVAYVAEVMDLPVIFISPPGPIHSVTTLVGNPFQPSSSPVLGVEFTNPSFISVRMKNLLVMLLWDCFTEFFNSHLILHELRTQLNYTGESPRDSLKKRSLLVLSNSHVVTHEPQPFLENVIQVGGLHIKATKPLPVDLQVFMDSSPQGVVLVSFGSSITPSSMSEEKRQVFLRVFENINIPVIWKWDTDVAKDVPKNVLIKDWLPQQDLLAHPNLKVFVTHGGLLSVMEAIYHETIVVGIPLANDQYPNLLNMKTKNIGVMLDWDTLNSEEMTSAIKKAMTDSEMSKAMKTTSRLFKDVEETPVKKAAWWVEFALRNKRLDFFKPLSMNLSFYQAWNLDLLALGLSALLLILYISYKLIRSCYRICFNKRKTKKE